MENKKILIIGGTGALGKTLIKLYQDANGDCLPLYRQKSEETTGGSFLDSRLYIG